MANAWPWLAIAAMGALHGLNPANGWLVAAAWSAGPHERRRALCALVPLGAGHAAAIALAALAVPLGATIDRGVLQTVALGLLLAVVAAHLASRAAPRVRAPAGQIGLALWSFLASSAHGAGLVLVPALASMCSGASAAHGLGAAAPLALALAAVVVHAAAMLATTALVATVACRAAAPARNALRALIAHVLSALVDRRPARTSSLREASGPGLPSPNGEPPWPIHSSTSS